MRSPGALMKWKKCSKNEVANISDYLKNEALQSFLSASTPDDLAKK
jgi:hypothetical protein